MILKTVEITNFRNYAQEKVELNDNINFFIGDNGQGKTNFLEMVYYLALGRSFKNIKDDEIINWHKDFSKLREHYIKKILIGILKLKSPMREKVKNNKNKWSNYRKLSDLQGFCKLVLTPEDLTIIKDGPQKEENIWI